MAKLLSESTLSPTERGVLDFEREWAGQRGGKREAIHLAFGFTPARYYQVLAALVDRADAAAYDPLLVKRLRRKRQGVWTRRLSEQVARPGERPATQ